MTIGQDSSEVLEIKVKSFQIRHRLAVINGTEKDPSLELNKLEEYYLAGNEVQHPKQNVVYICQSVDKYERCVLLDSDNNGLTKSFTVYLLDCENEIQVASDQLRSIASSTSVLSSPVSLSNEYYIGEFCVAKDVKHLEFLKQLQDFINRDEYVKIKLIENYLGVYICSLVLEDSDELSLPEDGSIESISLFDQCSMIADIVEKRKSQSSQQPYQMRPIARNLKAPAPPKFVQDNEVDEYTYFDTRKYKNIILKFNLPYEVRVSHIEDGANHFYIQLAKFDSELQKMTTQLQTVPLKPLSERPTVLAMPYLAKHHKKIYRVAFGRFDSKSDDTAICHFVDFGFTSPVKLDNLYYIPNELNTLNAFALPFCLYGVKNANFFLSIESVNYLFKQLIRNKLLTLKCAGMQHVPGCELYDNNINILESMQRFNPFNFKYPPQGKLELKKPQSVKVCYVFSTNEFYVQCQEQKHTLDYDMIYYELQQRLDTAPTLPKLQVGLCCGVKIEGEWFRGQIVGLKSNDIASVQVIDFGIIEDVSFKNIRLLIPLFFNFPSFAYRCTLKGFENMEVSENINTQFDIFCSDGQGDRRIFKMVAEEYKYDRGYIAELEDESVTPPANVNRILLKNSRPLAETITLENAKKRQKEASVKKEVPQPVVKEEPIKEPKTPERNIRGTSQRGRGSQKGTQRSAPSIDNADKRQRTHFGKQNEQAGTYFKSLREATSNEKVAKLNPSNSSSSFESWRESQTPENVKSPKSKNPKSNSEKKKRELGQNDKQKSPMKREKSSVDEKAIKKRNLTPGWVSTLQSVNKAYVHLEHHVDGLSRIMRSLFNHYGSKSHNPSKNINVGVICAFLSSDENFYRGEIMKVADESCQIQNLEYGYIEKVPKAHIFDLALQFAKEDRYISETYFLIKATDNEKKLLKEMKNLFKDGSQELNLEIGKKFRNGCLLEIMDKRNENFFDKLVAKKLAVRITEEELNKILDEKENAFESSEESSSHSSTLVSECSTLTVKSVDESEKVPQKEIPVEKEEVKPEIKVSKLNSGKITALTSPNDFYLSSTEALNNFKELHNDIQCIASAIAPLLDFECGTLCLAQYPFDNLWYRAKIIDSDETIITVLCIDNGKTFSIEDKISLKILPEQLMRKSFGMLCSLPVSIERKHEEEATEFMLSFIDLAIDYEIVLSTPTKTYVEVSINGEEITDFLVKKNQAKRLDIFQSGTGYTSHINSCEDFYIQLEKDQLKLELIWAIFDRAGGKFEELKDPKVGTQVAAKYNDDYWYRARIESIEVDGFTVRFIDYGNDFLTKEVGVLDESISAIPQMSKHCCLSKPKNLLNFSQAANKKFEEICQGGKSILSVHVIKPGDVTEVELFCDGQNIIDLLTPLCTLHDNTDDD